jgi:hypothetical protein
MQRKKGMKVTVIDAVMGAGKTYWMKRELARRTGTFAEHHERFVYITPYLKEAERGIRKRDHLYELVMSGKSAVGSHRLFEVLDPRTMSLIELGHHTLVIDEATQWGPQPTGELPQQVPLRVRAQRGCIST